MDPTSDYSRQPTLPPQPELYTAHPNAGRPKSKKLLFIALAVLLVVIAGALGLYLLLHTTVLRSQPSVTLYYSDGKTVLWHDAKPTEQSLSLATKAPYFVDLVRTELQDKLGYAYYKQGAWEVTTTLDVGLQAKAEKLVADNVPNVTKLTNGKADEEATILEDVTTGQIKALVGGTDRSNPDHGLINYTGTRIEPGSSIEPLIYAALIENTTNTGAGTAIDDTQGTLPGYVCTKRIPVRDGGNCLEDYDLTYPGTMSLRYAFGGARSVPAVKAAIVVGTQKAIDAIEKMGVDSHYRCYADEALSQPTQCYTASAIGDGAFLTLADETHAVATLANNGKKVPQTTIASVRLNGKVKIAGQQPSGKQIVRPDTAYIINDSMSDPNASYLPGSCTATSCSTGPSSYKFHRYNGWKFAVDNGTSTSGYDGVMASWSSKYAVVSWVGNHTGNINTKVAAGVATETLTMPLTRGLMEAAHAGKAPVNWAQPADIKTLPAFVRTDHIHYGDVEPSPATDLYPAWYQQ